MDNGIKKVSIVLPIIRLEGARRCMKAIIKNVNLECEYEIICGIDNDRIGCPKMIKKLVARTKYDLVMFLGDDTIPQPGFLKNALIAMTKLPDGWGLVGLNDQHHDGNLLATHWLADKRLLPLIGGEFFHTGYKHCFCDMELTQRCKLLGRYVWAEDAIIEHDHPIFKGEPLTGDYARVYSTEYYEHDKQLFLQRQSAGFVCCPGKDKAYT